MKSGGNTNHPKKGDRIKVDPIRKIKDIKAISKITQDNPRDHLRDQQWAACRRFD
jgi:hypothetical protein